ncbi:recombinase family protein [Streptomyces mirabilis]|uniref:recombinase family protein n=1 Tax=Streptomyces mirabilis TaxID=68239 RepID=UPI003319FA56
MPLLAADDIDIEDLLRPFEFGGHLYSYARISTRGQKLDRQVDALTRAGCERISQERRTGKNAERPELKAMLAGSAGPSRTW